MRTHNNPIGRIGRALAGLTACLTASLLLSACGHDTVLSRSEALPQAGWARKTAVPFEFDIQDTARSYRLDFSVRHDQEYPFMNAFFLIYTTFPNQQVTIDTLECILADYRGKWTGQGVGRYKAADFVLKSELYFPMSGHYRMEVKQALRMDTVKHISHIGLHIHAN